jgi:hypothetical protein
MFITFFVFITNFITDIIYLQVLYLSIHMTFILSYYIFDYDNVSRIIWSKQNDNE